MTSYTSRLLSLVDVKFPFPFDEPGPVAKLCIVLACIAMVVIADRVSAKKKENTDKEGANDDS